MWEVGGTSGMVTDDWETFRLYNLESDVDAGTCIFLHLQGC